MAQVVHFVARRAQPRPSNPARTELLGLLNDLSVIALEHPDLLREYARLIHKSANRLRAIQQDERADGGLPTA